MSFMKSANQLAHIFTKVVTTKVFYPFLYKLGMRGIMHQLEKGGGVKWWVGVRI